MKRIYFYSGSCYLKGNNTLVRKFSGTVETEGEDPYRLAAEAFNYICEHQAGQCGVSADKVSVHMEQFNRV